MITNRWKVASMGVLLAVVAGFPLAAQAAKAPTATKQVRAHAATAFGVLSNLTATNATVTEPTGPGTAKVHIITFTSTTRFVALGEAAATQGLSNTDQVVVAGRLSGTTFTANTVEYSASAFSMHRFGLTGAAQTASAGTLTVRDFNGHSYSLQVSPTTAYYVNGKKVTSGPLPTITPGEAIAVHGDALTTGAYLVTAIYTIAA